MKLLLNVISFIGLIDQPYIISDIFLKVINYFQKHNTVINCLQLITRILNTKTLFCIQYIISRRIKNYNCFMREVTRCFDVVSRITKSK